MKSLVASFVLLVSKHFWPASVSVSKLTNYKDIVAVVDAIATVDKNGKNWVISLVNRHPSENVDCSVKLRDKLLNGQYKATVLTGESADSFNDLLNADSFSGIEH
ncbi:MAG: hypothetical protein HQ522_11525, partial [Bacteroidetes bacterium]|nr:hypothetical protein [Bacteroidota bacterium]